MANDVGAMAISVLKAIPQDGDSAETALVTSAVATIEAARSMSRDPSPAEWDSINTQIAALTGETRAGAAVDPTLVPAGATADALNHPAEVPVLTPEQQKIVDDHPSAPPSAEASQANPVDPLTGVAAGMQPVTLAEGPGSAATPAADATGTAPATDATGSATAPSAADTTSSLPVVAPAPPATPDGAVTPSGPFATSTPSDAETKFGADRDAALAHEKHDDDDARAEEAETEARSRKDLGLPPA